MSFFFVFGDLYVYFDVDVWFSFCFGLKFFLVEVCSFDFIVWLNEVGEVVGIVEMCGKVCVVSI